MEFWNIGILIEDIIIALRAYQERLLGADAPDGLNDQRQDIRAERLRSEERRRTKYPQLPDLPR